MNFPKGQKEKVLGLELDFPDLALKVIVREAEVNPGRVNVPVP